jgi:hypothetical protein
MSVNIIQGTPLRHFKNFSITITITTPVVSALKNYYSTQVPRASWKLQVPADILNLFWIQAGGGFRSEMAFTKPFRCEMVTKLHCTVTAAVIVIVTLLYNASPLLSSWTPGVFYTCFYNHARRLRLEKLLYIELSRSSDGLLKPLLELGGGFASETTACGFRIETAVT